MQKPKIALAIAAALIGSTTFSVAHAGGITYKDGEKHLKIGGRIQLQYHLVSPDGAESTDEVRFRRLRPYIEGSLHPDWKGKIQWDMGKANGDNELSLKDAYLQYKGIDNLKISIGNKKFPFSREALTSSKKQQIVERTFVGDHNYGTPDRNLGVHLSGHTDSKRITWGAAIASSAIDPDANKLDFDTPANRNDDFNEGWIIGGRIDFHPFGVLMFSQGDFSRKQRATIGIAAFNWSNDGDNNDATRSKPDVDAVTGFEVSAAYRIAGFSLDAQYNSFTADTVNSAFTGGIYKNGSTTLSNWAIEGGYMIIASKLELVASISAQDADNYQETWNRTELGVNYFFHKHDIKTQLTYRMGESLKGVDNKDEDEVYLQMQYIF
ncbi:MAG: OprO/OprP family phosphate-selective porin [Gammaproteobacteria bacterium]|nr:OprO/OprP family phosphate-selective porin [Gammaproteobacteria bacterium]